LRHADSIPTEVATIIGAFGANRPCDTRLADLALVAEDRSAAGVRDRTGPDGTGTPDAHEIAHGTGRDNPG
jgi:hypothetical protein